jgi:putative spermidine/putrescine transport system permease protein
MTGNGMQLRSITLLLMPSILLTVLLLVVPVGFLFRYSFYQLDISSQITGGFSFANFTKLLADRYYLEIIGKTLMLSFVVTMLALIIGLPLAAYLWKASRRIRFPLTILILSPLLVSIVVSSYGWIVILGTKGIVNNLLLAVGLIEAPVKLLYTNTAITIGLVHLVIPFMVLPILSNLERIDAAVTEAAAVLGANPLRVWTQILLPLLIPGIAGGTNIVFALAMSAYVTPAVLGPNGPNFITTLIYQHFVTLFDWATGSALAVILFLLSMTVIMLYSAFLSRLGLRALGHR